ncbi:hypothetical protein RhoFasSB10_03923 [Rhodococcus fascians]|nr:hypothetical protein [Rhodococcus fascians]NIL91576.1 hypothetical protein [Rhodococcus fascians]
MTRYHNTFPDQSRPGELTQEDLRAVLYALTGYTSDWQGDKPTRPGSVETRPF